MINISLIGGVFQTMKKRIFFNIIVVRVVFSLTTYLAMVLFEI